MARHIYFHIPFCAAKCPYCSFYSVTRFNPAYKDAVLKELSIYKELINKGELPDNNSDEIDTVYFGGGTPSVPDSEMVCEFLTRAIDVFDIKDNAEITIEVNPFSFTLEKAKAYKTAGFNRVSIGIQSLDSEVLKTLGRLHDREQAIKAVSIAKEAGFTNISTDMIIGVPGQTLEKLIAEADELISLGAIHISMYSLTIEEGTPFYAKYKDTLEDYVSQEEERAMYHGLRDYLKSRNIIPYEISNCAMPGFASKHNNSYWEGREYIALGAGSHGYINGIRYGHDDNVEDYIKAVDSCQVSDCNDLESMIKRDIIEVEEELSFDDKMHEYAMLMLRTMSGIDREEFFTRFCLKVDDVFEDALKANKIKGFLEDDGRYIRLTGSGLDFANSVFSDFI